MLYLLQLLNLVQKVPWAHRVANTVNSGRVIICSFCFSVNIGNKFIVAKACNIPRSAQLCDSFGVRQNYHMQDTD